MRRLGEGRWGFLAQGICAGLYLGRVMAETSPRAWRLLWLLPLVVGTMLVGLALSAALHSLSLRAWPLTFLLGYVAWPWVMPALCWALLFVVVCMLLVLNARQTWAGPWLGVGVFLCSLGLYVNTLAPTVLPADSGEFQVVGAVLGIAHPPGYPLYTLLGRLFTLLPVADPAYRMNLFAAACGALTLAIMAQSVRRATGSTSAGLIAAGTLGLSATYWSQSTTSNIRSLTALFTTLCLALLLRWREKRSDRYLVGFAACFGLGIGHHTSIALLGLPFLAYVPIVAARRSPCILTQPRRWAFPLVAFASSFLVLLYLPLCSLVGSPFDPSPIRSWDGFVNHVLALGFRGDMLYFRALPALVARLRVWLNIMRLQFGPVLPVAAVAALLPTWVRDWRVALLLLGTWAINTLAALTYRAPQTVEYLIPSYVALAMLLGYGLGTALRLRVRRSLAATLITLLALSVAINGLASYPSFLSLHKDTSARDYAEAILSDAPRDSLVLSNWHRATTFWYLQIVEGMRPDVEVRYVYPEGSTPNEAVWLRRIARSVGARPVVITNRFHAFAQTDYRWVPLHGAWIVRQEPLVALPEGVIKREVAFEEGFRILGFRLDAEELAPGETMKVSVYSEPGSLERYSSFVQLLGPDGVVGQADIAHHPSGRLPGEIRVDAYSFPLLLHAPPGEYQLVAGFYYTDQGCWRRLLTGDREYATLAIVTVHSTTERAVTLHPTSQRFENGLCLTGIDYDRSIPGQTRFYLHWWRPRRLTIDLAPWQASPTGQTFVRVTHSGNLVDERALPEIEPGSAATVALDVPASLKGVSLSLAGPDGQQVSRLGPWHRPTSASLWISRPSPTARYVPLGGEMAFLGFRAVPPPARPGDKLSLCPRFLALGPLTSDYSVSVGLVSPHTGWEEKSDGTPALGAIPTLKWLRGWLVQDPHVLTISAGAPRGEATTTLTVYDAFTLRPLHVLDERLVRQGQGTHLELNTVRIQE